MTESVILEKLATLWPEIIMISGACICMVVGLSPKQAVRRSVVWITGLALAVAGLLLVAPHFGWWAGETSGGAAGLATAMFVRLSVILLGLLLWLTSWGVPDLLPATQVAEAAAAQGRPFNPSMVCRGEYFAFFLFSLTGAMLCASANDLVWLFLALELTSLPTYIMVATGRNHMAAQEAGLKYFFLGALSVAIFLYGFSLVYGATGTTVIVSTQLQPVSIAGYVAGLQGEFPPLLATGLLLSLVGLAFKIAAFPMHFYVADVYQGAATPVTALLAFVPKMAGFVSIMLLLSVIGWPLPAPVMWVLWIMAAVTMTVGNVLGLLQNNVKRVLAYSSIAHSGYLLVGIVAGPTTSAGTLGQGLAAVLFYIVVYGLATIGAFSVLGCLRVNGEEAQTYDEISGLSRRYPGLALLMLISILSLIGLPPLAGFVGKVYLFGSAISGSFIGLMVVAAINTAVSAVYYLRIIGACYFGESRIKIELVATRTGRLSAGLAAIAVLVLGFRGGWLVEATHEATRSVSVVDVDTQPQVAAPDHLSSE